MTDLAWLRGRALQRVAERHGQRFMRFGVVGVSGVVVNMTALWLLVTLIGLHHLVAAAVGAELSILSNFALNDRWTFGGHGSESSYLRRALHYNTVAACGTLLSLGILAILVDSLGLHYLVANPIAIGLSTVSNYLVNSRFTWATHRPRTVHAEYVLP